MRYYFVSLSVHLKAFLDIFDWSYLRGNFIRKTDSEIAY